MRPRVSWIAVAVLVLSLASTCLGWLMARNEQAMMPGRVLLFGTLLSLLLAWTAQNQHKLKLEIAERKRMEEALRASQARFAGILEISAAAVISTDATQRIILYNQAAETLFEHTAREALGQPLDMLIPARLREIHRQHVSRFAQSDRKNLLMSERHPVWGMRKDGTEFPMAASVSKFAAGGETVFTILCNDITREVEAEKALRQAHDELEVRVLERTEDLLEANRALQLEIADRKLAEEAVQELSGRIMRVQDEERRHLARELHDGATQSLVAAVLNLNFIRGTTAHNAEAQRKLDESLRLVEECTNELRTISYLLHPPLLEELGVARTLSVYVEGFSKRSGIKITITIQPEFGRVRFEVELAIFRIVQEALSNIHRHSRSATANILLTRQGGSVVLEVADQGRGIPPGAESTGVGIAAMRERVRLLHGQLEIKTGVSGATIRAVLPSIEESRDQGLGNRTRQNSAARETRL